jgi:hypothetical protein
MITAYQSSLTVTADSVRYVDNPVDFAFAYILASNALVDSILRADDTAKARSGWNGSGSAPSAYYAILWERTRALTLRQFQQATVDLASLWYTAWVNAGLATAAEEDARGTAVSFALLQNYPNPFNPSTTISFVTERAAGVRVEIVDILGRSVATLADGPVAPGRHAVAWNAHAAPAGIYFCRIRSGARSQSVKLLLAK